jgi:PAS domain S-box-containing protein
VFNIVSEDTRELVENPAARAIREGTIVGLANHTVLISRQGTDVPIDDSASPIRDAQRNITDNRVLGRSIYQIDEGPWDVPELRELLDGALNASRSTTHIEIERQLNRVRRKSLRLTASRFAAGSERNEAVMLVISAVTEERILEEESRRQNQHMRWFLEQIKDYAISTMDSECKATSWNQGVKLALGFDEEEFIGHDIRKLIFTPEAQAAGIPETEFSLAALDQRASDDRWMMRIGGEKFWASGITTSIRDQNDHLIGYSKVLRDLTSTKEAQDGLSELATRLAEVDRRKNELLATLAHELRNPLAPIKNAVQLMGLSKLDPEMDELRLMMARQVVQLVRLIDDLLDVSRIRQRPDCSGVCLVAITGFGQSTDRDNAIEAGFNEQHRTLICER